MILIVYVLIGNTIRPPLISSNSYPAKSANPAQPANNLQHSYDAINPLVESFDKISTNTITSGSTYSSINRNNPQIWKYQTEFEKWYGTKKLFLSKVSRVNKWFNKEFIDYSSIMFGYQETKNLKYSKIRFDTEYKYNGLLFYISRYGMNCKLTFDSFETGIRKYFQILPSLQNKNAFVIYNCDPYEWSLYDIKTKERQAYIDFLNNKTAMQLYGIDTNKYTNINQIYPVSFLLKKNHQTKYNILTAIENANNSTETLIFFAKKPNKNFQTSLKFLTSYNGTYT